MTYKGSMLQIAFVFPTLCEFFVYCMRSSSIYWHCMRNPRLILDETYLHLYFRVEILTKSIGSSVCSRKKEKKILG